MAQTSRLTRTSVATTFCGSHESGIVTYHGTPVVSWDEKAIGLDTGGWETATTKLRMNQTSSHYGLRFGVTQRRGVWYITTPSGEAVMPGRYTRIDRETWEVTSAR